MLKEWEALLKDQKHLLEQDVQITQTEDRVVLLQGEVDTWQQVVEIGHLAGRLKGIKGVVNRITAKEVRLPEVDRRPLIAQGHARGPLDKADVVIVGAGITGLGIARELAKYELKIIVVDKNADISEGTTKANNGMIHSGYDSPPGTLKAKMNVLGNALYSQWAGELNFSFHRRGSFVVGFDEEDDAYLEQYYERGKANGVPGIAIIGGEQARKIEPHLHPSVRKVLWTPSAAYVEPYEVALALAENAVDNGVVIRLSTQVVDVLGQEGHITGLVTDQGILETRWVINAAGVYADEIAAMAGDGFYTIHPRRGALVIFDKKNKGILQRFIGTPPKNFTKGGGPMETPEGNPIWGPSAVEVPDKEDVEVDQQDLDFILNKSVRLVEGIGARSLITFFSGLRACTYTEDFIIEASEKVRGFIHAAGIQSPGLASAPAIARQVEAILLEQEPAMKKNARYHPLREKPLPFRESTQEEREELIKENPKHARIICRCETITEGEILQAIQGKIPAATLDAVKRRTRAGMGRCQGGFCGPRVVEILARELGIDPTHVTVKGENSPVLVGKTRQFS